MAKSDYDKGREVLARRLEIESSLLASLRKECVRVIMSIAELGYSEAMDGMSFRLSLCNSYDRMLELMKELRLWIYQNVTRSSELAVGEVESRWEPLVPLSVDEYINRETGGKTLKERIGVYGGRLLTEAEMWVAAGLLGGYTLERLRREVTEWLDAPYKSRAYASAMLLPSARKAGNVRLRRGAPHFGAGSVTSAVGSFERLLGATLGEMVKMAEWLAWGSDERITGYNVYRGSSYPCSLCDMMTGFHPKGFEELPPYHARCCCFAVPVIDGHAIGMA